MDTKIVHHKRFIREFVEKQTPFYFHIFYAIEKFPDSSRKVHQTALTFKEQEVEEHEHDVLWCCFLKKASYEGSIS